MADSIQLQIELADGVSAPAKKAATATDALLQSVTKLNTATTGASKALMSAGSGVKSVGFGATSTGLSLQKADPALAKFTANVKRMRAAEERATAKAAREAVKAAKEKAKADKEAITGSNMLSALGDKLGISFASNASGAMMAAGAVAGFAAAAAAAAVGATAFAFSVADSKRSLMLNFEAMLQSADAAKALDSAIGELSTKTPVSKDRLEDMAKSLVKAGLRGDSLKSSLEALAVAEGATGDSGASAALEGIIAKSSAAGKLAASTKQLAAAGISLEQVMGAIAANTGKSIGEVEAQFKAGQIGVAEGIKGLQDATKARFGDTADKQMLSLSVQFRTFKTAIADMFEGIDIEPMLKALQGLLSIFNENEVVGKALASVMSSVFGAVGNAIAASLPYVKSFVIGLLIGFLRVKIALKPVVSALSEVFAKFTGGEAQGGLSFARMLGTALGYLATAIIPVLATAIAAVFGPVMMLIGGIRAIWSNLQTTWAYAVSAIDAIRNAFASFSLFEIGANIIEGLRSGIMSRVESIKASMLAVGESIKSTFTGLFQIQSPSKVFAGYGGYMAEGLAQGMTDGASMATNAAAGMMTLPSPSQAKASVSQGAAPSAGGTSFQPGAITININGGTGSPQETAQTVLSTLTQAFEQMGLSMGVAV